MKYTYIKSENLPSMTFETLFANTQLLKSYHFCFFCEIQHFFITVEYIFKVLPTKIYFWKRTLIFKKASTYSILGFMT
jgi:hypothetical protein